MAVLVALDSSVVDMVEIASSGPDSIGAMEACEVPRRLRAWLRPQTVEVFACYWLLAMASAWRLDALHIRRLLYDEGLRL